MEKRKQLDGITEEKSGTSEENHAVDNREIKHKVFVPQGLNEKHLSKPCKTLLYQRYRPLNV